MSPDIMYALCPACEEYACVVKQMEVDDPRQRWGLFVTADSRRKFHFLCGCPCGAHFSVDADDDEMPF